MKLNEQIVHLSAYDALVVNDHFALRKGLKFILDRFTRINSCDIAENGLQAVEMMKKHYYHLVLLDLNMPVMDGTTAYYNIRKYFPYSRVIIMSMSDEKRRIIELVKAGIDGYLMIDAEEEEMNIAVAEVMEGRRYFTKRIQNIWNEFTELKEEEQSLFLNLLLSHRELEVVDCICHQMSAKQIAEKLNISEFTVNNHRSKIMKKLGVDNTVGLVMEAVKMGIVKC